MVRMTSELETNIVAVERVKEYSDTAQEVCTGRNSSTASQIGERFLMEMAHFQGFKCNTLLPSHYWLLHTLLTAGLQVHIQHVAD